MNDLAEVQAVAEHNLVITRFHGVMDLPRILAYLERLASIDWIDSANRLVDCRDISAIDLNFEGLGEIVDARAGGRDLTGKIAIVSPDEVSYGFARMYQQMVSEQNTQVQIFRDMAACAEWLAIPIELAEGG